MILNNYVFGVLVSNQKALDFRIGGKVVSFDAATFAELLIGLVKRILPTS